jgi:uncharacterized protein YeaO (DUF488 family)
MKIKIKRIYDAIEPTDGLRVIVDRLWPRGIKKENLTYDLWAKDISPSPALRQLWHQDPEHNWDKFAMDYKSELDSSEAFENFVSAIKEKAPDSVTLLYAYKNQVKNHAIILQQEIINKLKEWNM